MAKIIWFLLQLWHCVTALEDQMPQLSPPRVKLVPRSLLFGGRRALVIFGSEDALEVGAGGTDF